jgi:hypothetical protein
MATFKDVKARAERNPAFLAQLVVNPKKALADANLKVTAPADVARLELFAKMAGEQIRAAGAIVGIKAGQNEWGIGAGCCNSKVLMPGGLKTTPR